MCMSPHEINKTDLKKSLLTIDSKGCLGTQRDQVQITFKEGYLNAFTSKITPPIAGTPDRKVVQKLVNGEYVRK